MTASELDVVAASSRQDLLVLSLSLEWWNLPRGGRDLRRSQDTGL